MLLKLIILTLFIASVDTFALNYSKIWKKSKAGYREENEGLPEGLTCEPCGIKEMEASALSGASLTGEVCGQLTCASQKDLFPSNQKII